MKIAQMGLMLILATGCAGTVAEQYRMAEEMDDLAFYRRLLTPEDFRRWNEEALEGWNQREYETTASNVRLSYTPEGQIDDQWPEFLNFFCSNVGMELEMHPAYESTGNLLTSFKDHTIESRHIYATDRDALCEIVLRSKDGSTIYTLHRYIHNEFGVMIHLSYSYKCEDLSKVDRQKWIDIISAIKTQPKVARVSIY